MSDLRLQLRYLFWSRCFQLESPSRSGLRLSLLMKGWYERMHLEIQTFKYAEETCYYRNIPLQFGNWWLQLDKIYFSWIWTRSHAAVMAPKLPSFHTGYWGWYWRIWSKLSGFESEKKDLIDLYQELKGNMNMWSLSMEFKFQVKLIHEENSRLADILNQGTTSCNFEVQYSCFDLHPTKYFWTTLMMTMYESAKNDGYGCFQLPWSFIYSSFYILDLENSFWETLRVVAQENSQHNLKSCSCNQVQKIKYDQTQ